MRFTWHAAKSDRNLRDRGFDFPFAYLVFAGRTLKRTDDRRDYGEPRMVAIGRADGVHLTVVYTDRQDVASGVERRIISARRSNHHERQAYQEAIEGR
jgi:hypothetical protein